LFVCSSLPKIGKKIVKKFASLAQNFVMYIRQKLNHYFFSLPKRDKIGENSHFDICIHICIICNIIHMYNTYIIHMYNTYIICIHIDSQIQAKNKFGWSERSDLLRFYTHLQLQTGKAEQTGLFPRTVIFVLRWIVRCRTTNVKTILSACHLYHEQQVVRVYRP
jgi:hypothetical protein